MASRVAALAPAGAAGRFCLPWWKAIWQESERAGRPLRRTPDYVARAGSAC
jgi:hypothetical protein